MKSQLHSTRGRERGVTLSVYRSIDKEIVQVPGTAVDWHTTCINRHSTSDVRHQPSTINQQTRQTSQTTTTAASALEMSLVSSFTLRPYSSMSSSCCDDDGGGNGSSAFDSYASTNNPNHQRNHPIPLSDTHPTNTLHQFIPIGNGIFAGTMLQDRPKRPASLRFELGGERHLQPQMPVATQSPYLEEESEQPRTPRTLFMANANAEPDYKARHFQSEILAHEYQREISRLQEEKRQLRLKVIALQAQLLESQTTQQQQGDGVPLVEDPATPQNVTRHARSDSESLPQQVDDDDDSPPVQVVTYSMERQHQHPEHQQDEDVRLCNDHVPVEAQEKENTNPAITTSPIVQHKKCPEASSSDDSSGRNHGSRSRKRLHNDEVSFEKPVESTPPNLVTTRRSSRRRAKTTVTTTTTTPPDSPPRDGLVDAMVRSAVRKSKRRAQSGDVGARNSQSKSLQSSSSSPLMEQLNKSCKSLSPIPMKDDEKVEYHLQVSGDIDIDESPRTPPFNVVPATSSVGIRMNDHVAEAATTTTTLLEQRQGERGGEDAVKENLVSDDPRPKRRRKGLLLLPNSFQAPALKKKKGKKR